VTQDFVELEHFLIAAGRHEADVLADLVDRFKPIRRLPLERVQRRPHSSEAIRWSAREWREATRVD
jgi:hypothetical protein